MIQSQNTDDDIRSHWITPQEEFASYVVAKLIEAKICEDVGAKFAKKLMAGLNDKPEGLGTNGRPSFRDPSKEVGGSKKVNVEALLTDPPDFDNPNLEGIETLRKNPDWNPERPAPRNLKKHLKPLEIGSTPGTSIEGHNYNASPTQ